MLTTLNFFYVCYHATHTILCWGTIQIKRLAPLSHFKHSKTKLKMTGCFHLHFDELKRLIFIHYIPWMFNIFSDLLNHSDIVFPEFFQQTLHNQQQLLRTSIFPGWDNTKVSWKRGHKFLWATLKMCSIKINFSSEYELGV